MSKKKDEKIFTMVSCMLSILDSLKLYDQDSLELGDETLSEMMFRKMAGHGIDLNKELGFDHLKPVKKPKPTFKEYVIRERSERFYALTLEDINKHHPHLSIEEVLGNMYSDYKFLYE